jgi:hypothetical protein
MGSAVCSITPLAAGEAEEGRAEAQEGGAVTPAAGIRCNALRAGVALEDFSALGEGMPSRPPPDVKEENGRLVRELHGVTLVQILEYLVAKIGWDGLASRMTVNCFRIDPSVKSSLVFLRRTPWARTQVEALYVELRTDELRRANPSVT